MGLRPDGGRAGSRRAWEAMTRYVRTVAWAVVGVLVLALVASLVLEGFA